MNDYSGKKSINLYNFPVIDDIHALHISNDTWCHQIIDYEQLPGRFTCFGLLYGNGSLNNFLRMALNSLAWAKPWTADAHVP